MPAIGSTRNRCGTGRFPHSFSTTLSMAGTPNPAPGTGRLPVATASSCAAGTSVTADNSLGRSK